MLFGFVRNQGDGWTLALDYLLRYLDDALNEAAPGAVAPGRSAGLPDPDHFFLALARQLGLRTAQMHRALAEFAGDDPDFVPEPITSDDLAEWRRELEQAADNMLARLERSRARLPEPTREVADAVLASQGGLMEAIRFLVPDKIVAVKSAASRRFPSGPGDRRAERLLHHRFRGRAGPADRASAGARARRCATSPA